MTQEIQNSNDLDSLLVAYKGCSDSKKKRMLHIAIVEEAMSFVKKIANSISSQSGISHEDLVQVGSIGLIKAIEFFNPEKNTKFKTFASYFVRGEIKHYLRDKASLIKAPRELQELVFKISNTIKKLNSRGDTEPSAKQIAEELGLSESKIQEVMEIEYWKSLSLLSKIAFRTVPFPTPDGPDNTISNPRSVIMGPFKLILFTFHFALFFEKFQE